MLNAVRNGRITDEFLDATKAALRMAGDQVSLSHANILHLLFFIGRGCLGQQLLFGTRYFWCKSFGIFW